jgi:hypothetical protein
MALIDHGFQTGRVNLAKDSQPGIRWIPFHDAHALSAGMINVDRSGFR